MRDQIRLPGLASAVAVFVLIAASVAAASSFTAETPTLVSGTSSFIAGCEGVAQTGTNYLNSEVEPRVAVNPANANNIIGVWQQDRWSNGGAHALVAGVSHNGGTNWTRTFAHFSRCAGGTTANGGDYERASDPWVTFAPNGHAYQISISFNDSNTTNAVLVSKSTTGGDTWTNPVTLIRDTAATVFNDKEAITADPGNSNFVYAVWDRLVFPNERARGGSPEHTFAFRGPILFSRTTDGGGTWEKPRVIFDPGQEAQTIGNQIVVLPNGDLVDVFNLIRVFSNAHGLRGFNVAVIRSKDKGITWSKPIIVSKLLTVGVTDPDTGQAVRTGDIIPDIAVDQSSGKLYAVWQDGRFSGFTHDDIAFSQSGDGGLTWSTPIKVNKTTGNVAAFTATVRVAGDGTVGVTYYDFRNNTPALGLLTDYWLVHCHSSCTTATNWSETHVAGSFDMETAPFARGFFVGDYEGLATVGDSFVPFFVQANTGNTTNRTDVFFTTVGP